MATNARCALVTGTSSGLGAALAHALLEAGWSVTGMSRRPAGLTHPGYTEILTDLGDLAALRETAEQHVVPLLRDPAWRRVGLVNNAAAIGAAGPVEDLGPLELARAFAVNSVAPVFLMGLCIRHVAPGVPVRIVNVSTGAAVQPYPGMVDYAGSKAALRMAGMCVAEELRSAERPGGPRPEVSIVSYAPGVVDTPMQEQARAPGRPWNRLFVDMHAQGQLQPAALPAAEILGFLSGDDGQPFEERRFGQS